MGNSSSTYTTNNFTVTGTGNTIASGTTNAPRQSNEVSSSLQLTQGINPAVALWTDDAQCRLHAVHRMIYYDEILSKWMDGREITELKPQELFYLSEIVQDEIGVDLLALTLELGFIDAARRAISRIGSKVKGIIANVPSIVERVGKMLDHGAVIADKIRSLVGKEPVFQTKLDEARTKVDSVFERTFGTSNITEIATSVEGYIDPVLRAVNKNRPSDDNKVQKDLNIAADASKVTDTPLGDRGDAYARMVKGDVHISIDKMLGAVCTSVGSMLESAKSQAIAEANIGGSLIRGEAVRVPVTTAQAQRIADEIPEDDMLLAIEHAAVAGASYDLVVHQPYESSSDALALMQSSTTLVQEFADNVSCGPIAAHELRDFNDRLSRTLSEDNFDYLVARCTDDTLRPAVQPSIQRLSAVNTLNMVPYKDIFQPGTTFSETGGASGLLANAREVRIVGTTEKVRMVMTTASAYTLASMYGYSNDQGDPLYSVKITFEIVVSVAESIPEGCKIGAMVIGELATKSNPHSDDYALAGVKAVLMAGAAGTHPGMSTYKVTVPATSYNQKSDALHAQEAAAFGIAVWASGAKIPENAKITIGINRGLAVIAPLSLLPGLVFNQVLLPEVSPFDIMGRVTLDIQSTEDDADLVNVWTVFASRWIVYAIGLANALENETIDLTTIVARYQSWFKRLPLVHRSGRVYLSGEWTPHETRKVLARLMRSQPMWPYRTLDNPLVALFDPGLNIPIANHAQIRRVLAIAISSTIRTAARALAYTNTNQADQDRVTRAYTDVGHLADKMMRGPIVPSRRAVPVESQLLAPSAPMGEPDRISTMRMGG